MEAFSAGTLVGAGSFRCDSCGFAIACQEGDQVPACPECGGEGFSRSSLFDTQRGRAHHAMDEAPAWLESLGDELRGLGPHVAFDDDDGLRVIRLAEGWTRIGRSLAAHVRLDDPTVSRRHALLYSDENGARVLDDRSLNGVFVNGERVEHAQLEDGDEVAIGRFRLYFTVPTGAAERAASGSLSG
jgi:predicted RNA-binding Zn-ribbon protein involved in translation (DUF1610 family)